MLMSVLLILQVHCCVCTAAGGYSLTIKGTLSERNGSVLITMYGTQNADVAGHSGQPYASGLMLASMPCKLA